MDEQDFKKKVHEFVKLSDTIAMIGKRLAEAKKTKTDMSHDMVNYMQEHEIDEVRVETLGGRLLLYDSKRTETLKRTHIETEILELVGGDNVRCAEIVDRIYGTRAIAHKPMLSRRKK